uniref:Disease resistance protein RPM1-like n=1 Tax=Nelumbo nucifera TaxID=4432 RepID=A0A822ZHM8_NELNU|nr:TPA_asm: hypothetical protein HUJ06_001129 [Nelumbo nucifera]
MDLGALPFLLSSLRLLLGEAELIRGIHEQIRNLTLELEEIQAVLMKAYKEQESNGSENPRIKQFGEIAYDIEVVIDKYKLYAIQESHNNYPQLPWNWRPWNWGPFHSLGREIENIRKRINDLKEHRERCRDIISISSQKAPSGSTTTIITQEFNNLASLFLDESQIIGFDKPVHQLISRIREPRSMTTVISIVGMGGLGKTTLVRKVYNMLKETFECHAWVAVEQSYSKTESLKSLSSQIVPSSGISSSLEAEPHSKTPSRTNLVHIMAKVKDYLQHKRYVVVFDNIWKPDIWENFSSLLPNNECGSRIIVTTRRNDVANSCTGYSGHVYNLQPLPLAEARELLCKRAFSSSFAECPAERKEWSEKIVTRCEGLPLAIVEIGKLILSNKSKAMVEWRKLHDTLGSELARTGSLSRITGILSLSFNNLSYHHTNCLLYLGIFPRGYSLSCRRLIRLWMAEGFIEEMGDRTLEDVAEDYLNHLIGSNLLHIVDTEIDGRPRTCRLHYLMNDIIVSRAENEDFFKILRESNQNLGNRIRRLLVHDGCRNLSYNNRGSYPYVRSFFRFPLDRSSSSTSFSDKVISNFRLLKVLDLENAPLDTFPNGIDYLLLLRYLSLRNTRVKNLPKSLGKLVNLETLDLKHTFITKLPSEIAHLHRLRHLLVYRYDFQNYAPFDCVRGVSVHEKIGGLTALQKLAFVKASKHTGIVQDLKILTQLRKLGIVELKRESGKDLCISIEKMQSLHSLSISSQRMEEHLDLQTMSYPPRHLQRLYLKGHLQSMPRWISELHDLVRIRLKWSKLKDNPIEALQDLPSLMELQLLDAYSGDKLEFMQKKFKKLKILEFEQLCQLRTVILYKGTLPNLQKLVIRCCPMLRAVPRGIDNLTQLKELELQDMDETFINGIRKNGGECRRMVNHIPKIRSCSHGCWTDLS